MVYNLTQLFFSKFTFPFFCKKANLKKKKTLARTENYVDLVKSKSFITSHFDYYPIIKKFRTMSLNNQISKIRKWGLRIVYQNNNLSGNEDMEVDGSISVHNRNVQFLARDIFKLTNNLTPEIMKQIFEIQASC